MTSLSLDLRSASYGSLQQQIQTGGLLPIQISPAGRSKPCKMMKEKEKVFHWICKFAPRKKVGMLLLFAVSTLVFGRVLYVGKGLIPLFLPSQILHCLILHFSDR